MHLSKIKILNEEEIRRIILRISHQILEKNKGVKDLCLVGIQLRGVYLAQRIKESIYSIEKVYLPLGVLDITFYRDDLARIGPNPLVRSTDICFDINDKKVVLIDDVLFTGRTVRCALDEIMDFGRPSSIQLVILIVLWRDFNPFMISTCLFLTEKCPARKDIRALLALPSTAGALR